MERNTFSLALLLTIGFLVILISFGVYNISQIIRESYDEPKSDIEKRLNTFNVCNSECISNTPNQYEDQYISFCKDTCISYTYNLTKAQLHDRFICNRYSAKESLKKYAVNCSRVD